MRVLVDENIPRRTVEELSRLGHEVADLRGGANQGADDSFVWAAAQAGRRLLITTDKGFTEHRGAEHCGILVVRLRQPNREKIHAAVMAAIERFAEHEWPNLLVVVRDSMMSVARSGR